MPELPFDISQVDWVMVGVFLVVLVVGWTIVKTVLRLTMRVFALGCMGLLVLGGIVTAVAMFGGR
jgi:hypothetical protein